MIRRTGLQRYARVCALLDFEGAFHHGEEALIRVQMLVGIPVQTDDSKVRPDHQYSDQEQVIDPGALFGRHSVIQFIIKDLVCVKRGTENAPHHFAGMK